MDGIHLTGDCTVLAILLLRALLFRHMPKRVLVLLWAGALAILLVPFPVSSPLSVYALLSGLGGSETAAAFAGTGVPPVLAGVWPVLRRSVSAAALLGLGASYLHGLLRLHRSRPVRAQAVEDWLAAHPLLRPLRVRIGGVASPVSSGLLLPRIVLPADLDLTDRSRLDCVLTHEYVHVCRFDPTLKLLAAIAVCLRWYDPFVWTAALMAGRDMEYACDEAVLDSGIPSRRYAAVLLRAALRRAERLPATARLNAGQTERRVERVTAHRPHSCLCWATAVLLALVLLLGFGTAPRAAEAPLPEAETLRLLASEPLPACKPDAWVWDPAFPAKYDVPTVP